MGNPTRSRRASGSRVAAISGICLAATIGQASGFAWDLSTEHTAHVVQNGDKSSVPNSLHDQKGATVGPAVTRPSNDAIPEDLMPIAALIRKRDTGGARVRLQNYLVLHPDSAPANFLFGLSYHREQKYGQAIPYYQKAKRIDASFGLTDHFQGWAQYYLGDLDAARESFERFLKTHPNEPDSIFAVGLIELDEDNLEEAAARFRRSITILEKDKANPDIKALSKAHARLGEALERLDKLAQARQELEVATQLYPDHYEAWYRLNRVLIRLGQTEEAKRVHAKYLQIKERVHPGTSFPE